MSTPDPPMGEVKATSAAASGERVEVTVGFCVGPAGQVHRVTLDRTSGFEDLDQICVRTVETWRFTPPEPGAGEICSKMDWAFDFRPRRRS
ncbi:MAG: energy transducer TonB [Nannocystaceae bacterium]